MSFLVKRLFKIDVSLKTKRIDLIFLARVGPVRVAGCLYTYLTAANVYLTKDSCVKAKVKSQVTLLCISLKSES